MSPATITASRRKLLQAATMLCASSLFTSAPGLFTPSHAAPTLMAPPTLLADWESFVQTYMSPQGRIRDTGNANASHSEGQGYAMLVAATLGDAPRFQQLLAWTLAHLPKRADGLLSWLWRPNPDGVTGKIADPNNASDGDILIAWALLRAEALWPGNGYGALSASLRQAVAKTVVVQHKNGLHMLLPAAAGFVHPPKHTLNLSYWIFPAFTAFAAIDPTGPWAALNKSGAVFLSRARFGTTKLVPNWFSYDARGTVSRPVTHRGELVYGFDAVRVPLYRLWGGATRAELTAFDTYARVSRGAPAATIDLITNKRANFASNAGVQAIYRAVALKAFGRISPPPPSTAEQKPRDYYGAILALLTQIAVLEAPTVK
jgi:endoglucanase